MEWKKAAWVAAMVVAVLSSGCTGKEGPMGPTGPQGPAGNNGVSLVSQFTVIFSATNSNLPSASHPISVSEILNKQSSTFCEMYWSTNSSTSWSPLADGDTGASLPYATVSWTLGTVTVSGMQEGDKVLIKVFQHN
jgi:hypothetical protein